MSLMPALGVFAGSKFHDTGLEHSKHSASKGVNDWSGDCSDWNDGTTALCLRALVTSK
jgi:hypothetical protein